LAKSFRTSSNTQNKHIEVLTIEKIMNNQSLPTSGYCNWCKCTRSTQEELRHVWLTEIQADPEFLLVMTCTHCFNVVSLPAETCEQLHAARKLRTAVPAEGSQS
jgi:hypothetical protein